ncbi:MAG TPA: alpha/beta fold hydrolase [Marmoricola sp.]|nr:alpha/beta fold hydrolase [Marmoricola sp.]
MKRVVAVLVAAVLGLSLAGLQGAEASPGPVRAAAAYTPPPPVLTPCSDNATDLCGQVLVPLDYANEAGEKISLAVRVHPHDATKPSLGVMLVNPGGPGGSGTGLADYVANNIPNGVGKQYDVVGFDPRGVGDSTPSLHCNSRYFGVNRPNYVPKTRKLMRFWKTKAARYASQCGSSAAARLLPHVSTMDTVMDMDTMRQAFAADKLSFYGFSYGTYLAQVYATRFPTRVDKFVMDGVVNPTDYWYGANLKQEIGFDRNLNIFFKWVARNHRTYHLGTRWRAIRHGYNALLQRLDRHPAYHRKLGPDELTDAMVNAGYYVYNWDYIASSYAKLVRRHAGGPIFRIYRDLNMGDDNGYAMYLAVQCTDAPAPAWRTQVRDAWRIHRKHPFLAWDNTWFNAPCRTWRAAPQNRIAVSGAEAAAAGAKFLLINETKDAATPYSGAVKVRSLFPSSALIAGVGGTTHAGSLSGVSCVDDRIATFLASGTLPPRVAGTGADVNCPKVPAPSSRYARTAGGGLPSADRQQLLAAQLPRL